MSNIYCRRCGNELFFRRIINGSFSVPVEIETIYGNDESREVHDLSQAEIITICEEYYQCGECGSEDIEEPERDNGTNEHI